MNFRISARVISQLGAELISSDEVAIFELVKNGFDAMSDAVEVSIRFRASTATVRTLQEPALAWGEVNGLNVKCPKSIREEIVNRITGIRHGGATEFCILTDTDLKELSTAIDSTTTTGEALRILGKINSIDILDSGTGMSASEVERYYLTIGTTHRLQEVEALQRSGSGGNVPAGEKGIGRLSAMRLGSELEMFTATTKADSSVYVGINWREFSLRRDEDLQSVKVNLQVQARDATGPGTLISISDLNADWPRHKAEKLGSDHLAKFIDPFPHLVENDGERRKGKQVVLRWNGESIDTSELIAKYLESAQNVARCRVMFSHAGSALIDSEFSFGETTTRSATKVRRRYTLADFSGITESELRVLGPFDFVLYHFPRNRLKAIPLFASRSEVKSWLDRWAGGLMIFRDGVRVLPYATEGDDWLNLDEKALRGRGFRVNRIQVVGCVRISRLRNPLLVDQTNREGLRDNEAFRSFRALLARHIQENFVSGLDAHLGLEKPDFEQLGRSVSREYDALTDCAETLQRATKDEDWSLARAGVKRLRDVIAEIGELNDSVEKALAEREGSRVHVLELAATGMAAEAIAHDLEGVVETAISSLNDEKLRSADARVSSAIRHIRSVHKSLLVQVKQLSPGPAKARRRASTVDIFTLIRDTASFYEEKLRRHSILLDVRYVGERFDAHVVAGHIRQILDNLFRNSVYWLVDSRKRFPDHGPARITIVADERSRTVRFGDSGIGIAVEDAEWVFQAFNSRRENGRGLGLFICKELAGFNKVSISLEGPVNRFNRLSTFLLTF